MKPFSIILWVAGTCLADPPQATLDALEVPDAVDVAVVEKRIAQEDFPTGLLAAMSQFGWGGNKEPIGGEWDDRIPDQVDFRMVDLNSDGSPEYFANTYLGGTGGLHYLLFAKNGDGWQCIGESGMFKLLPKKNGWHRLVSFGRSGPTYFKHFYEFSEGRYRHVETHEILDGKVTVSKIEPTRADPPAPGSKSKAPGEVKPESDSQVRCQ